jgi:hypothetical protein
MPISAVVNARVQPFIFLQLGVPGVVILVWGYLTPFQFVLQFAHPFPNNTVSQKSPGCGAAMADGMVHYHRMEIGMTPGIPVLEPLLRLNHGIFSLWPYVNNIYNKYNNI